MPDELSKGMEKKQAPKKTQEALMHPKVCDNTPRLIQKCFPRTRQAEVVAERLVVILIACQYQNGFYEQQGYKDKSINKYKLHQPILRTLEVRFNKATYFLEHRG